MTFIDQYIAIQSQNELTVEGVINLAKADLFLLSEHNTPQLNADKSGPSEILLDQIPPWFDVDCLDLSQYTVAPKQIAYVTKKDDIEPTVQGFSEFSQYRSEKVGDNLFKIEIIPVYRERLHIDMSADIIGAIDPGIVHIGEEQKILGRSRSGLEALANAISSEPSYEIEYIADGTYQMTIIPIMRHAEQAEMIKKLQLGKVKGFTSSTQMAASDHNGLRQQYLGIDAEFFVRESRDEKSFFDALLSREDDSKASVSASMIQTKEGSEYDEACVIASTDASKLKLEIHDIVEKLREEGFNPGFASLGVTSEPKYKGANVSIKGGNSTFNRPASGVVNFKLDVKNRAKFAKDAYTDVLETASIKADHLSVKSLISTGIMIDVKAEHTRIRSTGACFRTGILALKAVI